MDYDPTQVYQPEADTFLLLEAALREVRPDDRVIEVGTGAGLIASRLVSTGTIVATDINPHAVRSARERGAEVVRTDLVAGIRGPFDLVLFNPPYLPTRPEERIADWLEYALDGGSSGRDLIERFSQNVGGVLAPDGRILLLVSALTGLPEVIGLFARQGFCGTVVAETDAEGEGLYVIRFSWK
jgi:release factor glutamine methyltransferase